MGDPPTTLNYGLGDNPGMAGSFSRIAEWDSRDRSALIVLLVVAVAVAGSLTFSMTRPDAPVPERTVGDLTVTGSVARDGVDLDEYGGTATLTYTGGGDDVEWRVLDLDDTYLVPGAGGSYAERGYRTVSNDRTLVVDEPGRYALRMYVDGNLARTGTMVLDGMVERTFSWTQVTATASYGYSVSVAYMFSDYLAYAEDGTERSVSDLPSSRFAVVDGTLSRLESALASEYLEVRGSAARLGGQDYADYLLSFVQCCIAYPDPVSERDGGYVYDPTGGSGDLFLEGTVERWAYPLETLHRGYGDCEDTSFLAAALFSAAGYTAAVLVLPDHMVAAVGLDEFSSKGTIPGLEVASKAVASTGENLFFCETTLDVAIPCGYVTTDVHGDILAVDAVEVVPRS